MATGAGEKPWSAAISSGYGDVMAALGKAIVRRKMRRD